MSERPAAGAPAELLPRALDQHRARGWRALGSGTLRYSVFDVYRMTYYVAGAKGYPDGDYALEARYLRALSSQTLVKSAFEEMTRLAPRGTQEPDRAWLARAFPSVGRGDRLLAVILGGSHLEMYCNDMLCASLEDPLQVNTFGRIWLSEDTRAPELRGQLLACVL